MSHIEIVAVNSLGNTQLRALGDARPGESRPSRGYYSGPRGLTVGALDRLLVSLYECHLCQQSGSLALDSGSGLEKESKLEVAMRSNLSTHGQGTRFTQLGLHQRRRLV